MIPLPSTSIFVFGRSGPKAAVNSSFPTETIAVPRNARLAPAGTSPPPTTIKRRCNAGSSPSAFQDANPSVRQRGHRSGSAIHRRCASVLSGVAESGDADLPKSVRGIDLPTSRSWTAVREARASWMERLASNSRLMLVAYRTKSEAAPRSNATANPATLRLRRFPTVLSLTVFTTPPSRPSQRVLRALSDHPNCRVGS